MFPILPISAGQAMSIALTSYDGGVYFGINADRDGVRDAGAMAALLEESLQELVSCIPSVDPGRGGRRRPAKSAARAPRAVARPRTAARPPATEKPEGSAGGYSRRRVSPCATCWPSGRCRPRPRRSR